MYVIVSTIVFRYKSQNRIVDDLDTKSLFLFSLPPWFDRRNVSPKPLSLHRPPSWEEFQFFSDDDNSRHRRVKMGIPLAALWRFSLSRLYTWEPVQTLPFPSLISLHALLYPFFFPFLYRSRRIALVILVTKPVAKLASRRSFCQDLVKQRCI